MLCDSAAAANVVTAGVAREPDVYRDRCYGEEGRCTRRGCEDGPPGIPSLESPFLTEVHHVRDDPLH